MKVYFTLRLLQGTSIESEQPKVTATAPKYLKSIPGPVLFVLRLSGDMPRCCFAMIEKHINFWMPWFLDDIIAPLVGVVIYCGLKGSVY